MSFGIATVAAPLLHHAIESVATWLRVERNLAPRTRTAYGYDLQRFDAWLRESLALPGGVKLDRIERETLHAYLAHLRDEHGCKPATLGRVVASLRVLFQHAAEQQWLTENPAADLQPPRLAKRLPVYLTRAEIDRLFEAPERSTPLGRRDHAILVTLGYTGLRLQELVGLNTLDVDWDRATLRVLGKGRKERLVPMNKTVRAVLEGYLTDAERVVADGERAVFLNARGKRLSGRAVQYIVDQHAARAGIDREHLSPHKLRHTFATLLHERDVDLVDIQKLLGHASLTSTQIYTHTNAERLRGAIARLPDPGELVALGRAERLARSGGVVEQVAPQPTADDGVVADD